MQQHQILMNVLGIASVVMFFGSLLLLPVLIAMLPHDYFLKEKPSASTWPVQYQVFRLPIRIVKNLFGTMLIMVGIAMLVLPGQGLLTILLGLITIDLPGKRKLILWLVRKPKLYNAINWIRRKAHRPEMDLSENIEGE